MRRNLKKRFMQEKIEFFLDQPVLFVYNRILCIDFPDAYVRQIVQAVRRLIRACFLSLNKPAFASHELFVTNNTPCYGD